jgi:bifunctional oligoribonuclease and PAP phosphatase NrnA
MKSLIMIRDEIIGRIVTILKEGGRFLLTTHVDPDADGIGSMLALGGALGKRGKETTLLIEEPLVSPLNQLPGADRIVQSFNRELEFDAIIALDCGDPKRLGTQRTLLDREETILCIDHHKTNSFFGDINLVDPQSSSTGELIFQIIKRAGFPLEEQTAKNLFAAIQTDTGSFRYENASAEAFRIAAELVEHGATPWEISRIVLEGYSFSRLKLLKRALDTLEFHLDGKIGMMTICSRMFEETGARQIDSERFVDYPRFVSGVELSVLIRQINADEHKFSLRSNKRVDVADLASCFGGGGHARAAGFQGSGPLKVLKRDFLEKAVRFFDGTSN